MFTLSNETILPLASIKFLIKISIFSIFFLCFSLHSSAQIRNEKGVIKLRNGQSYSGDVLHFHSTPNKINITSSNGEKTIFSPLEIEEINLENGEKFMPLPLGNQLDTSILIYQAIILSEKISLFSRNVTDNLFFYVSKDKNLYPLEKNIHRVTKKGGIYVRDDNKYIGVLKFLMADRPDLYKKIKTLNLNENELSKLFLAYNKGETSYVWSSDIKKKYRPNLLFFTQFSNYKQYFRHKVSEPSYGVITGLQYYLSKESRHSFKVSLEYSNIYLQGATEKQKLEQLNLGLRYSYDIFLSEKNNFYFTLQIGSLTKSKTTTTSIHSSSTKKEFNYKSKVWPGLGYEFWAFQKLGFFIEVNHLFYLENIPKNFSVGVKYDFGKTTR